MTKQEFKNQFKLQASNPEHEAEYIRGSKHINNPFNHHKYYHISSANSSISHYTA